MKILYLFGSLWFCSLASSAQDLMYQTPPKAIAALADAPSTPRVSVSSNGQWMVLLDNQDMPTIADLSQPELRLGGLRINPKTNGPSRVIYSTKIRLKHLPDGKELLVQGLPAKARISEVTWSPDNTKIAFTHTSERHMELWILDVASASARLMPNLFLNGVFGKSYEWVSDSQTLLARAIVGGRGDLPLINAVPMGPTVQENIGKKAPARTYQDLLKSPADEKLFEFYATAQVVKVTLLGRMQPLGQPGIIQQAAPSPNGRYALIKTRHRPYSYTLPYYDFPLQVDIMSMEGLLVKTLADLPLADNVPSSFDAAPTGQRSHGWRTDVPSTLYWVEAQDGGDPKTAAPVRDKIFTLAAPFETEPQELAALPLRFREIVWGNAMVALVEGYRWNDRKEMTWTLNPTAKTPPVILFDRSSQDTYTAPGTPFTQRNLTGHDVLATDAKGETLYFIGTGASAEGDRPFVDELDVRSKKSTRWWRSEAPFYEVPITILDVNKRQLITRRESQQEAPNYFLREVKNAKLTPLTKFTNPYAAVGNLSKQVLKYKRADGVDLTANLYLPYGYKKEDGPLPTLMEAYPVEFKNKANASQVKGSPYAFTRLSWGSPIYWVTQGYAVLQATSIPIVGEGSNEPNDTYVEQLVASAQAAIDEGARLGVVDRKRVAVMGHSYGAFMTANLLAHTNLFKAGIARSGAYNRTLTPFGFQAEERTYWEVPEVYNKMSPFTYADKIKTPLLMIHGEADNNSGTFPLQSERFYNALKGHGATVRYVVLPFEAHGYAARESVMHTLWEMNSWLDKYVKQPTVPATDQTTGAKASN
ncbi:alpha/beta hydrolase family protein [Hymenobacter elongatus]|uniref:S9 family peptidase n=1 Tax=Hymenobacter elongatus TaxID=877208 RepID=A0A4Z0PGV3_9BACT|nr:prolyl oligopeptidase family serine peptidase [Hymenobacter elongatus]TGE13971.1 S9 family peptidase [Hymenobacter elongatus]